MKYTQDVISYGSEGLWKGIKEPIVFVFGGLTSAYTVLLFLKISLTEAMITQYQIAIAPARKLCWIGLLLAHIRTVISARFL